MTLARAIGRTMLSSYFVLSGIRAVRHPGEFVGDAQPITDRIVPAAKRVAPDSVSDFIPEDAVTLVRINGALQVAGGVALATGKGRRLGAGLLALSLIPTTIARHPFWSRTDPEERLHDRNQFVKNVSLLGGVIIASRDTEGKPSLGWRAQQTKDAAVKTTSKQTKKAKQAAKEVSDKARKERNELTAAAIGSGIALVEEAVEEGRKARKQAAKRAKAAAEQAQKDAKQAKKKAGKKATKAQQRALDTAEDVTKSARKTAGEVSKSVRKAAEDLTENIELGNN